MEFKRFYFQIIWEWFFIFPTIVICKDEQHYYDKNFSIQIHWLCFHLKWFWIKGMSAEKVMKLWEG